mmetsp:Transcript_28204/g.62229  ORF Transcript_28204/g.62229 Transcript_28204/m.62229 type:complete len:347 (-) Transcript_28204:85-1125(-)
MSTHVFTDSALFTWQQPVVSGVVLAGVNVVMLLLWCDVLLSVGTYVAMGCVGAGFLIRSVVPGIEKSLPQGHIDAVGKEVASGVMRVVQLVRTVLVWKKSKISMRALGFLYVVTFLTGLCSLSTVLFLTCNLAFALPPVMKAKRDEIDAAKAKAKETFNGVYDKIPRAKFVAGETDSSPAARPALATAKSMKPNELVGTLTVTAVKATGLRAADKNLLGKTTSSDPYVKITRGEQSKTKAETKKTRRVDKTTEPEWNESVTFKCHGDAAPALSLEVLDYDMAQQDDLLGKAELPFPHHEGEMTWELELTGEGGQGTITVKTEFVPDAKEGCPWPAHPGSAPGRKLL